jgi:hypothetical protein
MKNFIKRALLTLAIALTFCTGAFATTYIITKSGSNFVVTISGGSTLGSPSATLQNKINDIRTHASGAACTIQFGSGGSNILDLGGGSSTPITFTGSWGTITLTGKATMTTTSIGILISNGIKVISQADLTGSGNGSGTSLSRTIQNYEGTLTISGGTVTATGTNGVAVFSDNTLTISGGTVQATGANGIAVDNYQGTGTISGGTVKATKATGTAVTTTLGQVTVSGNATVTSANTTSNDGTIYLGMGGSIKITGGTISNTASGGNAVYSNSAGAVTISGGTVQATTGIAVNNNSTGTATISGGTVKVTGSTGKAIYNASTGTVSISGGTVTSPYDAIVNNSTGTINISGSANVSTTTAGVQSAIYNPVAGKINVSGGTVSGGSGYAIYSASTGQITVSGGTVTSAKTADTGGAICLASGVTGTAWRLKVTGGAVKNTATGGNAIRNNSVGEVTISGGTVQSTTGVAVWNSNTGKITISNGTVEATGSGGRAVYNTSTAAVNISGGTVKSNTGICVDNSSTGKITISGTAMVTSANTNTLYSTVYLYNSGTATAARLAVEGGTIENRTTGNAIYNGSTGAITISGGKITAKEGFAIKNNGAGTITISGGIGFAYGTAVTDVISGLFNVTSGSAALAAWNKPAGGAPYLYTINTSVDIFKLPATASVVWAKVGGEDGITVNNGSFIKIDGVTVVNGAIYHVTVNNGSCTGTGNYEVNSTVSITANAPPADKVFDKWDTTDPITFANVNTPTTTFTMIAQDVTVTATYKDPAPNEYAITVLNDGNGIAYADVSSAPEGTEITLTAISNSGYEFDTWEVVEGGVIVTDNKFNMPGKAVVVKAIFKEVVGIDEWRVESGEWRVFPNPTNSELRVESGEWRVENVEIFDVSGRKQNITLNSQFSTLN